MSKLLSLLGVCFLTLCFTSDLLAKEEVVEAWKEIPRSIPDYDGKPTSSAWKTIAVELPQNAKIISVEAFMKNETWGGNHNPPKPNTDDLGSENYQECPMGSGECPIGWSKVSKMKVHRGDGKLQIWADFANWAQRNDRTGHLKVTYELP